MLVVPSVSLWWNDAFNALQPAIRNGFREIASTDACAVYDLQRRPARARATLYERSRSQRRERRLRRTEDDRLLPSSVPPDSGERRLVGRRASRSGATSPTRGPCSKATSSPACRRASASTTSGYPRYARHRPTWHARTGSQASVTTTTGSQGSSCSSARSRRCSRAGGPTSPSASAGRTNRGRDVGTARSTTSSSHRATARRTTVGTSPGFFRPSATSERSDVDGKPLFLVYQGRELPDPARTVEIWQGGGARGRTSGDPSGVRRDRLGRGLGRDARSASTGRCSSSRSSRSSAGSRGSTSARRQPASTTISRHGARLPTRRRLSTTDTNASAPPGTTRPAVARTPGFSTIRHRPRTRSGWS